MFERHQVVTLPGETDPPRLTAEEVDRFANFAFMLHDHSNATPESAIYWWRTDAGDVRRSWN